MNGLSKCYGVSEQSSLGWRTLPELKRIGLASNGANSLRLKETFLVFSCQTVLITSQSITLFLYSSLVNHLRIYVFIKKIFACFLATHLRSILKKIFDTDYKSDTTRILKMKPVLRYCRNISWINILWIFKSTRKLISYKK